MKQRPNSLRLVWLLFAVITMVGIGGSILAQDAGQADAASATTQSPAETEGDGETAPSDATSADAAETADTESGDTETAADDPDAALDGPQQPAWITTVDQWFGDWLVTPMANVLFFDFWTGDTPTRKGWLGTSIPIVVVWLFVGSLFLTVRMGFINFRGFWHAIRLTRGDYDDPDQEGEVSHFQALASALSATVGLGNIAGVAIAIGQGGPGATFWMIVVGLLGMTAKFTECTLGQIYRTVDKEGVVLGGPMRYLQQGLTEKGLGGLGAVLATVFAVLCVGASLGGGNAFQVVQSLGAIQEEPALSFLKTNPWIYGLVMAVLAGAVIIGGIKSIGAVAGRIVPAMCGAYVLASLFILAANAGQIPAAISSIISGAFTPDAMYGGFLGVMVIGIKRAAFSNEAGVGSAAIAHSAAKTDEPVSEGIVALLEPFIDTVVVCTMTALVIVITGVATVDANADGVADHQALIAAEQGAALTSIAFQEGGYEWFRWILYLAVVLFAFSTLVSWSYYGERCFTFLFGNRASIVYKVMFLIFTFLGSVVAAANILAFSDILILSLAIPNILGLYIMSGKVRGALDDYWTRYKAGDLERK